jgi:hypothetical protein
MNMVGGPAESPWPKNVGLLFFNEEPEMFFPGTQIDVLWLPEGAGGDRFDEKSFKGPLERMTREALDYIRRNYLHETIIKQPGRPSPRASGTIPLQRSRKLWSTPSITVPTRNANPLRSGSAWRNW